jgi:hypothetical protein
MRTLSTIPAHATEPTSKIEASRILERIVLMMIVFLKGGKSAVRRCGSRSRHNIPNINCLDRLRAEFCSYFGALSIKIKVRLTLEFLRSTSISA